MRRQREVELLTTKHQQQLQQHASNDDLDYESILPVQARKSTHRDQKNTWMTSTFVPCFYSSTNSHSRSSKVAPWSQLADALRPRQHKTPEDDNDDDNDNDNDNDNIDENVPSSLPAAASPSSLQLPLHTGLAYHKDCANHFPRRHPFSDAVEIPERTTFTMRHISECGLDKICAPIQVIEASYHQLARVHDHDHIQQVNGTVIHGLASIRGVEHAGDMYASQGTARAARLAAGGVTEAALKVARGELANAMCIVRPPGHHCSATKPSGFCFFNNVAVAVRAAQREVEGIRKVLVVDWDVHHGDGTESIFYEDPSVCVISVHQHHFGKGHVFHRPAKEEMPGFNTDPFTMRKIKKEVVQTEKKEREVAQEDDLLALLDDEAEREREREREDEENDDDASETMHKLKLKVKLQEEHPTNGEEERDKKSKQPPTNSKQPTEDVSAPGPSLRRGVVAGNRRAAATSLLMALIAKESNAEAQQLQQHEQDENQKEISSSSTAATPTNMSHNEKNAAIVEPLTDSAMKIAKAASTEVDDDAAMALFSSLFGDEKLQVGPAKKANASTRNKNNNDDNNISNKYMSTTRDDDDDDEDNDSSRNTSSLNSQKLPSTSASSAIDHDHDDSEFQIGRNDRDDDDDEDSDDEQQSLQTEEIASNVNDDSHHQYDDNDDDDDQHHHHHQHQRASPLEPHTGPKFHSAYRKRCPPFYPGTGHINRVGSGEGLGRNINVPWPCTGFGDVEYVRIVNELIIPVAQEFNPDLIIVSCGLDCCAGDLLGGMKVTPSGVFLMTSLLCEKVTTKVVVALEGGYMLRNVALCSEAAVRALLQFSTPYDDAASPSDHHITNNSNNNNGTKKAKMTTSGLYQQSSLPVAHSQLKPEENGETGGVMRKKRALLNSTMLFDQTTRLIEDVKLFQSPFWKCLQ